MSREFTSSKTSTGSEAKEFLEATKIRIQQMEKAIAALDKQTNIMRQTVRNWGKSEHNQDEQKG
jgi:hypothetical protein